MVTPRTHQLFYNHCVSPVRRVIKRSRNQLSGVTSRATSGRKPCRPPQLCLRGQPQPAGPGAAVPGAGPQQEEGSHWAVVPGPGPGHNATALWGEGPADSSRALAPLGLLQPGDSVFPPQQSQHSAAGTAARLKEHCVAPSVTGEEGAPGHVCSPKGTPQVASLWVVMNDGLSFSARSSQDPPGFPQEQTSFGITQRPRQVTGERGATGARPPRPSRASRARRWLSRKRLAT